METVVLERPITGGIDALEQSIEALLDVDLDVMAASGLVDLAGRLEVAGRMFGAVQNRVLEAVDRQGAHVADGHASAKVWIRHTGRLSNAEATGRARTLRALQELSEVRAAFEAGRVGVSQVRLLGRVYANPRVREQMAAAEGAFVEWAQRLSYRDFARAVGHWVRMVDQDGPQPPADPAYDSRDAALVQDHFSLAWQLRASFGPLQGAGMREILDTYIQAEWLADWDEAKAVHGDDACVADLPRNDAQRRADALARIFSDAAGAPEGAVPPGYTHIVVWSSDAFEEMLVRVAGRDPQPFDLDTYRCETLDGHPLDPTEAAANALVNQFRRAIIDSAGVVIDLSRARRFTGGARTAVMLQSDTCRWPGCEVAVTRCEIDHVHDHAKGGCTDPTNGCPLCGRHNRWKQKGYRVRRDPNGQWHFYRPDGTEIPP